MNFQVSWIVKRGELFLLGVLFVICAWYGIVTQPFYSDEGIYAEIIIEKVITKEYIRSPYFGEHTPIKPPLFFFIYTLIADVMIRTGAASLIASLLGRPDSMYEVAVRFASFMFALINIALFWKVAGLFVDEERKELATIAFMTMPIFLLEARMALTDQLNLTFILLATYAWKKEQWMAGALAVGGGFLTRLIPIGLIPTIFIIDFLFKKEYKKACAVFCSTAVVMVGALLVWYYNYTLDDYLSRSGMSPIEHLTNISISTEKTRFVLPLLPFLLHYGAFAFPWIVIVIMVIIEVITKKKQIDSLLLSWIGAFPLLSFQTNVVAWYVLSFVPAFALVAAQWMPPERMTKALFVIFGTFGLISFVPFADVPSKEVGLFIAEKPNVAIIAFYRPDIPVYKFAYESPDLWNKTGVIWYRGEGYPTRDRVIYHLITYFEQTPEKIHAIELAFHKPGRYTRKIPPTRFEYLVTDTTAVLACPVLFENSQYRVYNLTACAEPALFPFASSSTQKEGKENEVPHATD